MCGIAAIFAYDASAPRVDRDELVAIRDQMAARGPDGTGEWISADGRVGLGHRRLSIIDLSENASQPMFSRDGQLGVVFNGEIYNYRELRAELQQRGCQFQSTSDTEVLLHLYAAHGEAMVDKLRGMYAFALWDGRKKGLWLVRDPLGIKPLYYADDGATLRAASQVKALLAGGRVDKALDPAGQVGYFLWGYVPFPHTLYRGIKNLPAGTTLWLDQNGNLRHKTFCTVAQILAEAEGAEPALSQQQADEWLRAAMEDTVRHHLVADVPVGVFLSSGVDSTVILALAAQESSSLRAITLGFEEFMGTPNDETVLAEKVARQYGVTHQTIWLSRADFQHSREHMFQAMDQPSTDGVNSYFVSLAANRCGLKVALSGLGGDELFGGYPSFRQIPRITSLLALARYCRPVGKALRILTAPVLRRMTSPKYASLFEYGGSYEGAYLLRRGHFLPWELMDFLDPEIVRQGWQELQPLLFLEQTHKDLTSPWLKVMSLETCWYMRGQLLRDADWAGMAHSLEVRVPLVDAELYRKLAPLLISGTPPNKKVMARATAPSLPAEVLNRPKSGFGVPVREWLLADAELPANHQRRPPRARHLRGWALKVYHRFCGNEFDLEAALRRIRDPQSSRKV